MQIKKRANPRHLLSVVTAAGLGGWIGTPAARGSFNLAWNYDGASGGYSILTLTAQNDGKAGAQQQPQGFLTGTGLIALDLTISTPGSFTSTVGAMLIDLNADIDGDDNGNGLHQQADADVSGQPDLSDMTPTPSFGSALGTFIGYNSSLPSSMKTNTIPLEDDSVWVNSQTYANFTEPATGGGRQSAEGTPALYETSETPDGLASELDPAFVNGTVHSLELIIQASQNDTVARPIANVVVPNGVGVVTAFARLTPTANPSNTETYTFSSEINPPPLEIGLTSVSYGNPAGTINLTGGQGIYAAQEVAVPPAAQATGSLTVNGFNPAGDREFYVLEANSNGAPMTSVQLAQFITDMQAVLFPSNGVVSLFTALPLSTRELFHNPYNLAIVFPTGSAINGGATSPDVLFYDVSDYYTIPDVTITGIGVVPEPGSVGVLVVGGMGLMGRRRRRAAAG